LGEGQPRKMASDCRIPAIVQRYGQQKRIPHGKEKTISGCNRDLPAQFIQHGIQRLRFLFTDASQVILKIGVLAVNYFQ
jgi:hypothetical protein